MRPGTDNCYFAIKNMIIIIILLLMGLSISSNALAAEQYRVTARVLSLGEVVANPMMEVQEGETARGEYTAPGSARYTIAALVRRMSQEQVSVSLQFTSGNINIQPNLLVDINKQTSVVLDINEKTSKVGDKVQLVLLVEEIVE